MEFLEVLPSKNPTFADYSEWDTSGSSGRQEGPPLDNTFEKDENCRSKREVAGSTILMKVSRGSSPSNARA